MLGVDTDSEQSVILTQGSRVNQEDDRMEKEIEKQEEVKSGDEFKIRDEELLKLSIEDRKYILACMLIGVGTS